MKPLLVPAAFFSTMAPELDGMVTLRSVVAKPEVTVTLSTHFLLSADATEAEVTTPAVLDANPKSATVTPVTAWLNVAVNDIVLLFTVVPDTPAPDENVGTGGAYLGAMTDTRTQEFSAGYWQTWTQATPTYVTEYTLAPAALDGAMTPLSSAIRKLNARVVLGSAASVTVSTHSVGPPVTAYATPVSTGNGVPPLKSAAVTPVTGALNVAVTGMVVLVVVPVPTEDDSIALGGL